MSIGRKLAIFAAAFGMTPGLLLVLPAAEASAHGYVSSPLSRQAQCADKSSGVKCGSIQFEPQSVEGPKGLSSCNGGLNQFADLNDDGKGWKVTNVGGSTSFTWSLTARHSTRDWQYFVDGKLVKKIDDGGKQPAATVTHNIDLGGFSGKHKMLAVWNIADTPNAFYSCVDLNIGGGGGGNPAPPATTKPEKPKPTASPDKPKPTSTAKPKPNKPGTATSWATKTKYKVGDQVTENGKKFKCRQNHTALPGWEPSSTPALWQKI
ncbi:cellulose-binding protein [Pseudonocardiaceae bacterium YIM PH 21723]|nr:cellulose-binding protein [Pseudonocardiaceae bacterium YIM PH 21723]